MVVDGWTAMVSALKISIDIFGYQPTLTQAIKQANGHSFSFIKHKLLWLCPRMHATCVACEGVFQGDLPSSPES